MLGVDALETVEVLDDDAGGEEAARESEQSRPFLMERILADIASFAKRRLAIQAPAGDRDRGPDASRRLVASLRALGKRSAAGVGADRKKRRRFHPLNEVMRNPREVLLVTKEMTPRRALA